jgi:hypothetical protein
MHACPDAQQQDAMAYPTFWAFPSTATMEKVIQQPSTMLVDRDNQA